jgi:hypothetical protein
MVVDYGLNIIHYVRNSICFPMIEEKKWGCPAGIQCPPLLGLLVPLCAQGLPFLMGITKKKGTLFSTGYHS